jgi:hypothetical protein
MTATVLQAELDAIKKETDDTQAIDDKFNELSRLYTASDSTLAAIMKKTQLMKIVPSLYSGCINMANQAAQADVTAKVFNDLIASMQAGRMGSVPSQINIDSIECTYKQLCIQYKSSFNICACHSQASSKRMALVATKVMTTRYPWGTSSSRALVTTAANKGTRQATAPTRRMADLSQPAAQTNKVCIHSRAVQQQVW